MSDGMAPEKGERWWREEAVTYLREVLMLRSAVTELERQQLGEMHVQTELRAQLAEAREEIKRVIMRCSTWHSPADARPIRSMCVIAEEQERGREQVLDELRAVIEKWPACGG